MVQILLKNDKVAFVFVMNVFISLGQIFVRIGKVQISRLDIVSLSRIKIHHTGIFFPLLLLLFLLFFSIFFSLLVESEIQESPQTSFDFPFERNEMSLLV